MSLLEVTDLQTQIASRDGLVRPVDGVSLSIEAGQCVGLVGESGSGKTMTGMSIMRLLPPGGSIVGGSVRFGDTELTGLDDAALRQLRGNDIALISQDPMTSLNPVRTIGSQLTESLRATRGEVPEGYRTKVRELLDSVGIPSPIRKLLDAAL